MGTLDRTVDARIAALASARHGVVTRPELLAAGLTAKQIKARIGKGTLLREYRGVYRVGHRAPSTKAVYLAAVLAVGDDAVLCGRAAAYMWGLVKGEPPAPEVMGVTERRVAGVATRRTRRPDPRDVAVVHGIPATAVARTLVDLAAELPAEALARACHEAGIRYGTTPREVLTVLARRPRSRGAARLRRVVEGDVHVTLSALEARVLKLLADDGLVLPLTNRPAGGRRVDCRWPEHRLTVELDGYRFHNSRYAWEQDRRREREARARGDDFRRYTYGDVFENPAPMMAELRSVLTKDPGQGPL